jgi:hypothetical protein
MKRLGWNFDFDVPFHSCALEQHLPEAAKAGWL